MTDQSVLCYNENKKDKEVVNMLVRRFAAAVALTTALAFTVPLSADAASVTHDRDRDQDRRHR